jgi:hypothetical protein
MNGIPAKHGARLRGMGEDVDLVAAAGGIEDRDGAWDFIRCFVRGWRTPILPGDGCDESEIARAEARLGLALPAAMREAYSLFGRRSDLTSRQDRLLSPDQLRVEDRALVYRVESQHVVEWAVPLSHTAEDDPPVWFRDTGAVSEPWRNYLGRFSLASVEIILSESVLSAEEGPLNHRALEPDDVTRLESLYPRLPLPDYPMWALEGRATRWFAGPGVLLREDAGEWLWVLGRSAAAVDGVRAALPGDWEM